VGRLGDERLGRGRRWRLQVRRNDLEQTVPSAGPFVGVWGFASGTVYVVGSSGQVLRYDGTTWKALQSGTSSNLTRVYGASTASVCVLGDAGTLLRTGQ
jgi:photosystem II stability/assembly factor-like uncharacterized protein